MEGVCVRGCSDLSTQPSLLPLAIGPAFSPQPFSPLPPPQILPHLCTAPEANADRAYQRGLAGTCTMECKGMCENMLQHMMWGCVHRGGLAFTCTRPHWVPMWGKLCERPVSAERAGGCHGDKMHGLTHAGVNRTTYTLPEGRGTLPALTVGSEDEV